MINKGLRRSIAPLTSSFFFALALVNTAAQAAVKIPLSPAMVTNEVAQGDAGQLVDEQALAGDPAAGAGGKPLTQWFPGWSSWYYPAGAVIDLGVSYDITKISLYDINGTGNVTFYAGKPNAWTPLFTDPQTSYQTWNNHTVVARTRYIRVVLAGATIPGEIVMYGTPLGAVPAPPAAVVPPAPLMDKFVGVNGFIDDPIGRLAAAGTVREYHTWGWDESNGDPSYPGYPNNKNKFSPSYAGGWDFDLYYANLFGYGLTASPCLQGSVSWLTTGGDDKPVPAGADPTLPSSYAAHADHMYQLAARYGSKVTADGLLKLAADQPRKSGLNTLSYFENWNEENKWWEGRSAYFSPYEFAAMCSADYDGHRGAMGTTVGVKNADPKALMVMGGLAEASVDYLKAIKLWSDFNRAGSIPFDVINFHHYSTDAGGQASATTGISPEADGLKAKMAAIVDYRNRYIRGKKVWVSEFGYDTNPGSPFRAPAIGSHSAEEVQGQWIVRSYLALAAAGVDAAEVYMLRDVDPASTTQFATSGLTSSKDTGWIPKASWYYVYTLKNRLTGFQFDSEVPSGNPNVLIYRFKQANTTNAVYAVWSPTSNDTTVPAYRLALRSGESTATLVTMQKGVRDGVASPLTVTGGAVNVNVSETPVFVQVTTGATFPKLYHFDEKLTLTPSMVVNESGIGDATMLVDEQSQVGDPSTGSGGAPSTAWFGGWNASAYPISAYIDLGKLYNLSQIDLRDINGTGNVIVSTGSPGSWTPLFTDGLTNYQSWNIHATPVKTRYIRVTLTAPGANLSEIAVYNRLSN